MKPEFIVSIGVNFGEVFTGGVLVLHKLAYEIASRGYKVTIFTNPEYPHENINIERESDENNLNFDYDINRTVIIPSFEWKNNNKIKHVARWLLYHVNCQQSVNVEKGDYVYNFGTFYSCNSIPENKLTMYDYHLNIFYDKKVNRNKKYCFILNKKTPENYLEIINNFDATYLGDWKTNGGYEFLFEKFNEHEYFLTFDDKSFYSTAAALCGTKSIILTDNDTDPKKYREQNPIQKFGVAYGINDIEWAENTINLVRDNIEKLQIEDEKTINNFLTFWEEKINNLQ